MKNQRPWEGLDEHNKRLTQIPIKRDNKWLEDMRKFALKSMGKSQNARYRRYSSP